MPDEVFLRASSRAQEGRACFPSILRLPPFRCMDGFDVALVPWNFFNEGYRPQISGSLCLTSSSSSSTTAHKKLKSSCNCSEVCSSRSSLQTARRSSISDMVHSAHLHLKPILSSRIGLNNRVFLKKTIGQIPRRC